MKPVLSLFPGADLLGMGFEQEGFCVVRGPEKILGGEVRNFHTEPGHFVGVIGGPPCQRDSTANRARDPMAGVELKLEFFRIVTEAGPDWWLMECVQGAADVFGVYPYGYHVQRIKLNARELGLKQNRPRVFHFGYREGQPLVIPRVTHRSRPNRGMSQPDERCCIASEAYRKGRRSYADFCELQGLPRDFNPDGLPRGLKYRIVGNGVPVPMARVIAGAIKGRPVTAHAVTRLCICECGREVRPGQTLATAACRKRMQRRRDTAAVTTPGPVTAAQSQELAFG